MRANRKEVCLGTGALDYTVARSAAGLSMDRRSLILLLLAGILVLPVPAHAYAGPGAGFAVLSSFWTIFVAFLYSFYALMTWPFRHLLRTFRRRKAYGKAQVKRVVVLGFDGMDPGMANRLIAEGKLPNLAWMKQHGAMRVLKTTNPAQSPVAWSAFCTGSNPGKTRIYDFLKRTSLIEYTPAALARQTDDIVNLARVEGLDGHGRAVAARRR